MADGLFSCGWVGRSQAFQKNATQARSEHAFTVFFYCLFWSRGRSELLPPPQGIPHATTQMGGWRIESFVRCGRYSLEGDGNLEQGPFCMSVRAMAAAGSHFFCVIIYVYVGFQFSTVLLFFPLFHLLARLLLGGAEVLCTLVRVLYCTETCI